MDYGYSTKLNIPFAKAVDKTIAVFKEQGFGVLTDIDVKETLKNKLNVDFKQYRILGMCNPPRAYRALQAEEKIGLLLPCNVIIYEKDNAVIVAAIKATAAFKIIDNKKIEPMAQEVDLILENTIKNL